MGDAAYGVLSSDGIVERATPRGVTIGLRYALR